MCPGGGRLSTTARQTPASRGHQKEGKKWEKGAPSQLDKSDRRRNGVVWNDFVASAPIRQSAHFVEAPRP